MAANVGGESEIVVGVDRTLIREAEMVGTLEFVCPIVAVRTERNPELIDLVNLPLIAQTERARHNLGRLVLAHSVEKVEIMPDAELMLEAHIYRIDRQDIGFIVLLERAVSIDEMRIFREPRICCKPPNQPLLTVYERAHFVEKTSLEPAFGVRIGFEFIQTRNRTAVRFGESAVIYEEFAFPEFPRESPRHRLILEFALVVE